MVGVCICMVLVVVVLDPDVSVLILIDNLGVPRVGILNTSSYSKQLEHLQMKLNLPLNTTLTPVSILILTPSSTPI